jgi:HAE1 family hydrophobic/amphiphilic exporter-1
VATEVGQGEGFMSLFGEGTYSGIFRIKLRPINERRRRVPEIEDDLRARLNKIPGVTATAFQPFGFGGGSNVVIEIAGHDLQVARRVGLQIKSMVETLPDAADVEFSMEEGTRELDVYLNRERMSALGINSFKVNSTISTFFQGTTATVYREGGDEFDVVVRAPRELRKSRRHLEELRILTPLGKQVPLGTIARIGQRLGPVEITRKDQQRVATVTVSSKGRNLGLLVDRIRERLDRFDWPEGFSYRISGSAEDMRESFVQLGWAAVIACLLVYAVMASQFESFLAPFIVFLTIPFTATGVALALFLTNTSISVVALIGVVVLAGVVVNNSIVLVDFANQRCAAGMSVKEATYNAGLTRLRPILMTALTTICGMAPLALEIGTGSESWSPLARVVIGGLAFATFVTLVFVPVAYQGMMRNRPDVCPEPEASAQPEPSNAAAG